MILFLTFFSFFTVVQPSPDNSPYAWCSEFVTVNIKNGSSQSTASLFSAQSRKVGTIETLTGCAMISVPAPKMAGHNCAFENSTLTVGEGELKITPWAPLYKYEALEIRPKSLSIKAGETYKPTSNPGKFSLGNNKVYPIILESVGGPVKNIHFDFVCQ